MEIDIIYRKKKDVFGLIFQFSFLTLWKTIKNLNYGKSKINR